LAAADARNGGCTSYNEGEHRMSIETESQEPVSRTTLMTAHLHPPAVTDHVEVRRIRIQPNTAAGAHVHNGPVVGNIVEGSVIYQIAGGPEAVLRAGDTFFEPKDVRIERFDAQGDGATFLAYFLLEAGQHPELDFVDPDA
jgi:quercetin dioxygenase-like cupin family protein